MKGFPVAPMVAEELAAAEIKVSDGDRVTARFVVRNGSLDVESVEVCGALDTSATVVTVSTSLGRMNNERTVISMGCKGKGSGKGGGKKK